MVGRSARLSVKKVQTLTTERTHTPKMILFDHRFETRYTFAISSPLLKLCIRLRESFVNFTKVCERQGRNTVRHGKLQI